MFQKQHSRQRVILKYIALISMPLLLTLIVIEIVLRVTHLATDIPWSEGDRMLGFKYVPNQTGTWVVGRFGDDKAQYHINSHGWNATRDYSEQRNPGTSRIAVIGDSYIEALNVPPEAAVAGVLEKRLSRISKVEVYPFGVSGAALSHYLAMMRYVRARFSPDLYIINIVHNDFEESLPIMGRAVFHAVHPVGDSYQEVPPEKYRPVLFRRMMGHLATVRYLVTNLKLNDIALTQNLGRENQHQRFDANIDVSTMNVIKMRGVVKYLFKKYIQEVDDDRKKLILVIDALRQSIYEGASPKIGFPFQYNRLTAEVCQELSLYCLDLTDPFWQDFKQNKRRFNSVIDGHWDAYGHEVAAKALEDFLLRNALVPTRVVGDLSSHAQPFGSSLEPFVGVGMAQTLAAYQAASWKGP
jgi:hypothetical protein